MPKEPATRKLAAILAADVVGYSRLVGLDEEGTIARLNALREELVDPNLAQHHGRVFKTTGDGMLVEFSSVVDAVRSAVEIQRAIAERNVEVSQDRRIEFRVGVNLGDIIVQGDDILGDGVNVAARLEGMAEPGGICVRRNVRNQVRDKLDLVFVDLGEVEVKNIARPVRVFRIELGDAGSEANRSTSPGAALTLPNKPSIAVLPFENMSGDPEQEYFSDGIADDIITALSKFRWFFVIARNSSFTYKGKSVGVKQVAQELGVRYVLEGSVRKAGNRVRISAQLVDATTGNHIWAERYDRELEDIFALQDEITESIAATVAPELVSAEMQRAQRIDVRNLDAWDCVMRASSHHARYTEQDVADAERLLRHAIDLDPGHAQAFCLLAFTHLMRVQFGWSKSAARSIEEAAEAAEKAAALDDRDAWAHTALGLVDLTSRRYDVAIRRLEKATALNPNLANALGGLGQALALNGNYDGAVEQIQKAIRLSPMDPFIVYWFGHLGLAAFAAERYEEAVQWAAKAIQQNPRFPGGQRLITASYGQLGKIREARASLHELLRLMPGMTADDVRRQVPYRKPADMDRYLDGLRKAGLPQ
jgi:TolB-like protein/cytochrome c-type biogenesis protein CcmH/NrfG